MDCFFLIGFMGSGKTSIGRIVAQNTACNFIDMDEQIEQEQNSSVSSLFAERGEAIFRELERTCLHQLADQKNCVVATGGGAPCFFDNMNFMSQHGETIYIKLSPEQIKVRLEGTEKTARPMLANKNDEELLLFIGNMLEKREKYYSQAKHTVSGDDEAICKQICQIIKEKQSAKA